MPHGAVAQLLRAERRDDAVLVLLAVRQPHRAALRVRHEVVAQPRRVEPRRAAGRLGVARRGLVRAAAEQLLGVGIGGVDALLQRDGEVAEEAGFPGGARAVGQFLKRNPGYPWWRIVYANGRLAPGNEVAQANLLRTEGVLVRDGHVVAMR